MTRKHIIFLVLLLTACAHAHAPLPLPDPFVIVLGIAQDGGYPQAGCRRADCIAAFHDPSLRRHVASLGIVDPESGERWIIDSTPDFPAQLQALDEAAPTATMPGLTGIALTHAHIGHYTGLMHLGREVLGTHAVPVYAMPRMLGFLEHNGPWSQLVSLENISLRPLQDAVPVQLNARITLTPLIVPHRDEYSETVGFVVAGPHTSILWLPDIDKWEKWPKGLESVLAGVSIAYVDGTFYDASELPGRDLGEIPHPLMVETMSRLEVAARSSAAKIRFIHLNQSNPALRDERVRRMIRARGFEVASEGERKPL
ncbi:MAG: MBL fold metallo-hydrolase [Acidobacteriota bacterium]